MSFDVIWGILLAGVLTNNYAILNCLGTGAVIAGDSSPKKSLALGLETTLVMVISTLIAWPLQNYLLKDVGYLQNMAFVIIILASAWAVSQVAGLWRKSMDRNAFYQFAVSGAVLGLCLQNAGLTYMEALITALAVGIGFALTAALFAKLHSRIDQDSVPAAFRGLPIDLLCAGMIALALLSF